MLLNARSISPASTSSCKWKLPFLCENHLNSASLPVPFFAITESWLKPHITDAQVTVPDFQCLRADRDKRRGGGCILYVHNSLTFSENFSFDDGSNNLLTCFITSLNTFIAVVYRPPNSSTSGFRTLLDLLQSKLDEHTKDSRSPDIYILGDFNLPSIDWELCSVKPGTTCESPEATAHLLDFMGRNFLSQMVNKPTRENNTLDLIFTNKPQDVLNVTVEDTKLSEHRLVEALLGFNPTTRVQATNPSPDPLSFRAVDIHQADYDAINSHLFQIDWKSLKENLHNDTCGDQFLELIRLTVLQVTLLHSPPKNFKSRRSKDKYIMKRKRRKLNARISALRANNPNSPILPKLLDDVNSLTYEIKELIESELEAKEDKAISKLKINQRYFFSYAKRFAKVHSTVSPIKDQNGELQTDPSIKAELLQSQYCKVFSDPTKANPEQCASLINHTHSSILENLTSGEDDIKEAIKDLDPYSSTPDGDIPAKVLKSCSDNLVYPLFLLWKSSFETGLIPSSLKTQYVTPVFKKGDQTDAANYRPISITSHIIKIFERVLRKRIVSHMETNNLLSDKQHGFRKKRSCLTQLIDHVDHILKTLNSGEEVDTIYLDYAKAFDKVDLQTLLKKLQRYGIGGKMLQWIRQFLLNRFQTVVVEGKKSSFQLVISGVPQGTVLGPIFFIIYINDQLDVLKAANGKIFADDTKLTCMICDIIAHMLLQDDLNNIVAWSLRNNMLLNGSKFELLNYSLNKTKLLRNLPFTQEFLQYTLADGTSIEPSKTVRDLGVLLSNDCSWTPHIQKMLISTRKVAAWVLSVFRTRTPALMMTLYKTMVRSKLEYCCPVWNPAKVEDIRDIENIQRNFTRKISNCKGQNYWERLKTLKIMSLQRRRERYTIIHTWKIASGAAPNDIGMIFNTNQRRGLKAIVPSLYPGAQRSVSTHYHNSFGVKAAFLWNILPKSVNEKSTLDSFKVALGKFLESFPDTPPTTGYTAVNSNSLLEWNLQRCSRMGGLEDSHVDVAHL